MATGNITQFTEAAGIDEIFLDGVIRAREFDIVLTMRVDRSWEEGYKHGQTFHKRRIPNIETQSKVASTALNATVYTDSEQSLVINDHIACAIKQEDIAAVLSRTDTKAEMTKKMGYALARACDVAIAALFQNFSQSVGTYGVELTYDNFLRAARYLEDAGVSLASDVAWIVSPAQKEGMMKMDTFTNRDYVGDSNAIDAHTKAKVADFQQAPVLISNLLRAPASGQHDNVLLHKNGIALVYAQDPKTSTDRIALDLADVVVMDEIRGMSEVDTYSETPGNVTATDEDRVLLKGT